MGNINLNRLFEYLGVVTDKQCPLCGSMIIKDLHKTEWCSNCSWSNDDDLTEFIRMMTKDEDYTEISDRKENTE